MQAISEILRQGFETQNVSTLKPLMQLARLDYAETADLLQVSIETLRRWERTGRPNPTATRLLAILAGYVPWKGWRGWEVHQSALFAPGQTRRGMTPSIIESMTFQIQLREILEIKNRELKAELDALKRHKPRAPVLRLVK